MKIRGDITLYSLLRKLRSGIQILSHIEWVSAYGSHISTLSVLGIVGLVLVVRDGRIGNFKFLSDKDNSLEKFTCIPGLRNLGNNCFLNVVLQSLASCSSFRHFVEEVEELQLSSPGVCTEDLPLLISLVPLLNDLSTLRTRSVTLNPHNVMSAMQHYLPQFQLTNEQDAAEAFLHLLLCLRDEVSESYMPSCGSLEDIACAPSRILPGTNNINEPGRWRRQYLGPFDGILQSSLSCQSCSSEILMDFSFFHTLHLSLMGNSVSSFLGRLTLEDCIKRFLAPEHLENYFCSRCWHISAIKYLTLDGGKQEEIRRLGSCSDQDSCDCINMSSLEALPWSNHFSHTFKQLSIAQCPQILCLHLQRTSMNMFGELVKLQGHISFPLILNLSPFVKHEVGIQKQDMGKSNLGQHYLASISHPRSITKNQYFTKEVKDDASQIREICSSLTETSSASRFLHAQTQYKGMNGALNTTNYLYRLVSVVEHFGIAGSGHYTVYRGVKAQVNEDSEVRGIDIPPPQRLQWFRISDTAVHDALEEDVLRAEASLLFYERI